MEHASYLYILETKCKSQLPELNPELDGKKIKEIKRNETMYECLLSFERQEALALLAHLYQPTLFQNISQNNKVLPNRPKCIIRLLGLLVYYKLDMRAFYRLLAGRCA